MAADICHNSIANYCTTPILCVSTGILQAAAAELASMSITRPFSRMNMMKRTLWCLCFGKILVLFHGLISSEADEFFFFVLVTLEL